MHYEMMSSKKELSISIIIMVKKINWLSEFHIYNKLHSFEFRLMDHFWLCITDCGKVVV